MGNPSHTDTSDKATRARDDAEFESALHEIARDPEVQILKTIPQHKGYTTYSHCVSVARMSYRLSRILHLSVDFRAMIRAAMLHDFYLYDTETMPWSDYHHAIVHPKMALENAQKHFKLSEKERNVILSHMWPIPGSPLPRSKEAVLVGLADKICAFREMHLSRHSEKK